MSAPVEPKATKAEVDRVDAFQRIKWNGWGDYNKMMKVDVTDPMVVIHPTGKRVHGLVPFIHQEISGGTGAPKPLEPTPSISKEEAMARLNQPIINEAFVAELQQALPVGGLRLDAESRLTHIMGKNYRDLWRMRKGMIDRAPDAVVLPASHDEVVALVNAAHKHNVCLIPYGGGTNVTGCIEPSPFEPARMQVSVDLRRMNRMLSINAESQIAVFEAGVLGPDLDEQLARHGFLFGHDPDSYIHSTLGGWIGARSSGAMSNTYGDIEQMVLGMRVVTPTGVIDTAVTPRAVGPDLNGLFIGSEGVLGIVTEATVKIERIPEVRHYEGWLFPSFEKGYEAFRTCTKMGVQPTAMRLYDDDETRMSFALKTEVPFLQDLASKAIKKYLVHKKGFQLQSICLCIMGYEGTVASTNLQRQQVKDIFHRFNAFRVGAGAGQNWQEKKYDLPYVRDFALAHKLWADVFETTALYHEAIPLWRAVKKAVRDVWAAEGKKGWIGCHTAHQYRSGCCLYFTYAGQQFDDNDFVLFLKTKKAATEAMLKHKGTLTHHHGIGYEHVPWMHRFLGENGTELLLSVKATLDPKGICNPHKLLPVPKSSRTQSPAEAEKHRQQFYMFDKMALPRAKL